MEHLLVAGTFELCKQKEYVLQSVTKMLWTVATLTDKYTIYNDAGYITHIPSSPHPEQWCWPLSTDRSMFPSTL